MADFTLMKYRKIPQYKYQLLESYTHPLPDEFEGVSIDHQFIILANRNLYINKAYAWDGPSGPTFDTKDFMRGSLVHDVLYQLMQLGLLDKQHRKTADKILVQICKEDGMNPIRRAWVYWAVRTFGRVKPKEQKVYEI